MRTLRTVFLLFAVLAAAFAAPAGAQDAEPADAGTALGDRYESLTEALLMYSAESSGVDLNTYLLSGDANGLVPPGFFTDPTPLPDLPTLRARLQASNSTLNVTNLTSFDGLYDELRAKSSTIDGASALTSANFALELGQARAPQIANPLFDDQAAVPFESLAFGLFVNETFTDLIENQPDMFAAVQQSGLTSPDARNAFMSSMIEAGTRVGSDLAALPTPCVAEMMQAMGTGVAHNSTPGCGPCAAAGAYLHAGAFAMLDGTFTSTSSASYGSADSVNGAQRAQDGITYLDDVSPIARDVILGDNPHLAPLESQLGDAINPNGPYAQCRQSGYGVDQTLADTLPSVFADLATPSPAAPALPGGVDLPGPFTSLRGVTELPSDGIELPGVFANLEGPR